MNYCWVILWAAGLWQAGGNLKQVRDAYFASMRSSADAIRFEHLVDSTKNNKTPEMLCYKGAAEMLKAKDALNPVNKYSFFNTGKILIEQAVSKDRTSVECRFVRYSMQSNLPHFLGYDGDIYNDRQFIESSFGKITDLDLKKKIIAYLKQQKTAVRQND